LLVRGALPAVVVLGWFAACGGRSDLIDFGAPQDASIGSGGSSGSSGSGGSAGSNAQGGSGGDGFGGGFGGDAGSGNVGGSSVGGAGGTTIDDCGGQQCEGVPIEQIGVTIEPCCSENGKCGLDTSIFSQVGLRFDPVCQERNQPGGLDASCPNGSFTAMGIPVNFPGCCRPNGRCGYLVDQVAIVNLDLGCVDSTPMLDGGTAPRCGGGTGGAGGSGGTGGTCDPSFCPAPGFAQACCVGPDGPCGLDFGMGCVSIPFDGGPGGSGGTGGTGTVDAGTPGQVSCGDSTCSSGQKCCVTSSGPDNCRGSGADCTCADPNCTVTTMNCDGPEDCPNAECCAIFSVAEQRYMSSECQSSCNGQTEREMCHPGGSCPQGQSCSNSQFLPSNFFRCD
jgi:hypothetical protein